MLCLIASGEMVASSYFSGNLSKRKFTPEGTAAQLPSLLVLTTLTF